MLGPGPNATDGATGATRREAGVTGFDCGAGVVPLRALFHRSGWLRLNVIDRSGVLALFLPRGPNRGTEGLKPTTHTEQDVTARRRSELNRDRGARRLLQAIDAQRRLDDRRAEGSRPKLPVGPSDRRFAYLAQSHD